MTASVRKGSQLLALALASTTFAVVAGASVASAAPAGNGTTTTKSFYTGSADATAVDVMLTLPTNALNAGIPNPAELSLIRSAGAVVHTTSAPDSATSVSDLGAGSLVTTGPLSQLLGPVLSHTVTSTLTNPKPAPFQLGSPVPPNQLGLALNLTPLTATTDVASHNTSATASVTNGSLGSLSSIAPQLTGPLGAGLTALNTNLTTAIAALTAALTPVTAGVAPVAGTILAGLAPVTGQLPPALQTLLNSTSDPNTLAATLSALQVLVAGIEDKLLNGAALSLDGVTSSEALTPAGNTSTGAANVATASLFGGLVQLQATKGSATATATGTAGQGTAASNAAVVTATAGTDLQNILTVIANDQGLTASLLTNTAVGTILQPVIDPINAALVALKAALNSLDVVSIGLGTATHSVSADGTQAAAKATPAVVTVSLPGAPNLVALQLGAVNVVANRENVTTTNPTVKPPTIKKKAQKIVKPVAPTKKLAYTGANLPLTAGAALVLLGAAAGITRRRRGHSA